MVYMFFLFEYNFTTFCIVTITLPHQSKVLDQLLGPSIKYLDLTTGCPNIRPLLFNRKKKSFALKYLKKDIYMYMYMKFLVSKVHIVISTIHVYVFGIQSTQLLVLGYGACVDEAGD